MTKAPCKDCANRKVGCHATCKTYIEYRLMHDKETEQIKKCKHPYECLTAFSLQQREKALRSHSIRNYSKR